ncbi:MAG: SRPBCC family protein, partial [Bacteroidota bacterium]
MAKSVQTHIDIAATPERILEILMDFERYQAWNPFVTQIRGEKHLGGKLEITVQPPG